MQCVPGEASSRVTLALLRISEFRSVILSSETLVIYTKDEKTKGIKALVLVERWTAKW